MSAFIRPGFDLIAIGTEECERSLEASFFNSSKDKWIAKLYVSVDAAFDSLCARTYLSGRAAVSCSSALVLLCSLRSVRCSVSILPSPQYTVISSVILQAMHLIVFARTALLPQISAVESGAVATGLMGGVVGNKGGVAVGMTVGATSFLFVNAHFHGM